MPIQAENKHRYPANWDEISHRIRYVRADNRCERCGVVNHSLGGRLSNGTFFRAGALEQTLYGLRYPKPGDHAMCFGPNGAHANLRIVRIVLTVAHLNHTPEDCRDENLLALCQRCHLHHDKSLHTRNRKANARKNCAVGDLFLEGATA